jgi:uncharacterized protein (TIGR02145 family)
MKGTIIILSVIIFNLCKVNAQTTIELTFTGLLNGTTHQTLDSIKVFNLSRGVDTALFAMDTMLMLDQGTGIVQMEDKREHSLHLFPVYPNPFTNHANVWMYLPESGPVSLRIADLTGRGVALFRQTFQTGYHLISITAGKPSHSLLIVETATQRSVQQLISLGGFSADFGIEYLEFIQVNPSINQRLHKGFAWMPGDTMMFVGYAANLMDTIIDHPVQSSQYIFQFTIPLCPATATDINGNTYNTVQIGTQCWFRDNLKATSYSNGFAIPQITDPAIWTGLNYGALCWFNNDSSMYAGAYGALYNWHAVNTGFLCPAGWHVPGDQEWQTLEVFLGLTSLEAGTNGWRGTDEGGKMKQAGLTHWISPNNGATNISGFTGLPGGMRKHDNGGYFNQGFNADWWTSTAYSPLLGWHRGLYNEYTTVHRFINSKQAGYSVRCIRD